MIAKFTIGDKARFTGRVPDYVTQEFRHRSRTIVDAYYHSESQAIYYYLGQRGNGCIPRLFRSYELSPVNGQRHTIGRPRLKRKYHHKVVTIVPSKAPGLNLGGLTGNHIVQDLGSCVSCVKRQ